MENIEIKVHNLIKDVTNLKNDVDTLNIKLEKLTRRIDNINITIENDIYKAYELQINKINENVKKEIQEEFIKRENASYKEKENTIKELKKHTWKTVIGIIIPILITAIGSIFIISQNNNISSQKDSIDYYIEEIKILSEKLDKLEKE